MPRITVGIRVKPEANFSKNLSFKDDTRSVDLIVSGIKHEFQFDKVFGVTCDQEALFRKCAPSIIDDVLEGFNGCILTYGQTGAGGCSLCFLFPCFVVNNIIDSTLISLRIFYKVKHLL